MKVLPLHPWDISVAEAIEIQRRLSKVVKEEPLDISQVRRVVGLDVSFDPGARDIAFGAGCIFSFPDLQLLEVVSEVQKISFPYIPGLLSFRESPVLISCLEKLKHTPDVILVDAHGRAHPRRFGAASHLGVLLDVPTIGCAKTRLVGEYEEPPAGRGGFSFLSHRNEKIGVVLRTQTGAEPVFLSVGHKVDLESATSFVLLCAKNSRIPEPLRIAHQQCNSLRIAYFKKNLPSLF
ncbi:MAG: endonuclease V [bacterium JZ-2024 1]